MFLPLKTKGVGCLKKRKSICLISFTKQTPLISLKAMD